MAPARASAASTSSGSRHLSDEPAVASTASWRERYHLVLASNRRLQDRLAQLEIAHRRSLTVVKYEPSLPNNDVYTKQLLEENRGLLTRCRALELRLAKLGSTSKSSRAQAVTRREARGREKAPARRPSMQNASCQTEHEEPKDDAMLVSPGLQSLVTELRDRLEELEVDIQRLQTENELLRQENERNNENDGDGRNGIDETGTPETREQKELYEMLQDRMRQLNVLEAQYAHLQRKAKAKHTLYATTIERLEALTTELFDTKEALHAQCEVADSMKVKVEQIDSLESEVHRLRSENLKLNDVIATLTSRPLESWDEQMQKKTLIIAALEEEKNAVEAELLAAKKDADSAEH
ncbi:hypothetical protein ATCC90586_005972 [Pythium insidiosum]|nr:hypothetical protein ATCC90586_005972 [Pythium insidiosum]